MLQSLFSPVQNCDDAHQSRHVRQSLQNVPWSDNPCAWQSQIADASGPSQSSDDHGLLSPEYWLLKFQHVAHHHPPRHHSSCKGLRSEEHTSELQSRENIVCL